MIRFVRLLAVALVLGGVTLPLGKGSAAQTPPAGGADLAGLKTYMVEQAATMKSGTGTLLTMSEDYYDRAEAAGFDYGVLWEERSTELERWLTEARRVWIEEAHRPYELAEGMVAGVPSLAHFDVLIDAGPSAADDPANALDFAVELPDGRVLERPGSLFHYLTEPVLWGTEEEFVGRRVDLDGDGELELGEALPEANVLLGSTQALDGATADLQQAIATWEPTLSDAFTALVVMIPTMSGYFEEWRLSPYVLGEQSPEDRFAAISRLYDVTGILSGLQVTSEKVAPVIVASDPALASRIGQELDALIAFAQDLYQQEQAGTRFTPEQADQFGSEMQSRATALAGQIAQAAAVLGIEIQEA